MAQRAERLRRLEDVVVRRGLEPQGRDRRARRDALTVLKLVPVALVGRVRSGQMSEGRLVMNRFDGDESGVFVLDPRDGRVGDTHEDLEARDWLKKLRELLPVRLAKVMKVREE